MSRKKPTCLFNPDEYGYLWSTMPKKNWTQRRCARCGLFTVFVHNTTGELVSQCDGVETFWATWRGILRLAKERAA
jgi:hypothetical protein